jgi:hypothetical protein
MMKASHLIDIERDGVLDDDWEKCYQNRLTVR